MPHDRTKHGTYGGYHKGCKCAPCKTAGREYNAKLRERMKASRELIDGRMVSTICEEHGTPGGYSNYYCRCVKCTAAHACYKTGHQRKKKALQR